MDPFNAQFLFSNKRNFSSTLKKRVILMAHDYLLSVAPNSWPNFPLQVPINKKSLFLNSGDSKPFLSSTAIEKYLLLFESFITGCYIAIKRGPCSPQFTS